MSKKKIEELLESCRGAKNETRTFTRDISLGVTEKRAEDGSTTSPVITGYGAVFESESTGLPWVEVLARGCMAETDFSECYGLFNHEETAILGSVRSGSLSLKVDDHGLYYEITPPDNDYVRSMYIDPIRRGDVVKSSFRFSLDLSDMNNPPDEWYFDEDRNIIVRKINKIASVTDVSPVLFPAYDAADSSLRSALAFSEKHDKMIEARKAKRPALSIANFY